MYIMHNIYIVNVYVIIIHKFVSLLSLIHLFF